MTVELIHTTLYKWIATLHGLTGLIIFLTGILQFIMKKGGKVHRIIGRIYNYSWITIISEPMYAPVTRIIIQE